MNRAMKLAVALILAAVTPALAAYVLYFHVWGAWTVTCWRDMLGPPRQCRLSAPREYLGPGPRQNLISVAEVAPDVFRVTVEVRDLPMVDMPLYLRVDGYDAYRVSMDRHEGRLSGADAAQIISEMVAGRVLVYRVFTDPDGKPHDTEVPLAEFDAALEAYRRLLRDHKILVTRP